MRRPHQKHVHTTTVLVAPTIGGITAQHRSMVSRLTTRLYSWMCITHRRVHHAVLVCRTIIPIDCANSSHTVPAFCMLLLQWILVVLHGWCPLQGACFVSVWHATRRCSVTQMRSAAHLGTPQHKRSQPLDPKYPRTEAVTIAHPRQRPRNYYTHLQKSMRPRISAPAQARLVRRGGARQLYEMVNVIIRMRISRLLHEGIRNRNATPEPVRRH